MDRGNSLTQNKEKTELLYLKWGHTRNLPTENTNEIEEIELNSQTLTVKEQIKYLGVMLHKNLNWIPHYQAQADKVR